MFVLRQARIATGSSLSTIVCILVTLFIASSLFIDYTAKRHWGCSLPAVLTEGITWTTERKKGACFLLWLFIALSILSKHSQLWRGQLEERFVSAVKRALNSIASNSQCCQPRAFLIMILSTLAVGFARRVSDCIGARTALCFTFPRRLHSVGQTKNNKGRFFLLFVAFNLCSGLVFLKQTQKSPRHLDYRKAYY